MTLITGIIADSAGVPANGLVEFAQVARIDTGSELVTGTVATAQVVEGALRASDGSAFDMPANPTGTAVRVLERLGGRTFEWWTQIPTTGTVEYRSLVPVAPIDTPEFAPPSWLADVYQARDDAESAKTGAEAAKAAADTVAAGIPFQVSEAVTAQNIPGQATTAVASAAAGLSLVQAQGMPLDDPNNIGISIPFEDDSRTALEVDKRGRPTALSASLHVEAESALMGPAIGVETRTDVAMPGVAMAFAFDDDSYAATVGFDGSWTFAKPAATAAVAYGDSTTYGQDLTDPYTERWTTLLGTRLGFTFDNRGLSGAQADEIAAFSGGIAFSGAPTGGTIVGIGNTEILVSTMNLDPWRAGMGDDAAVGRFPVIAITDANEIVPGTFIRQSSTFHYFVRDIPGAPISTTKLTFLSKVNTNRLLFIGAGTNDIQLGIIPGTRTVEDVVYWYRSVTEGWRGDYIVWGCLDRGYNERPGTTTGDIITKLEAQLASIYGYRFVQVRKYLSSQRALDDAAIIQPGFTPTTDDTQAVSVGRTPPSFRYNYGSVHLNALGHKLQERHFYRYMRSRGLAA